MTFESILENAVHFFKPDSEDHYRRVANLEGHQGPVNSLAFDATGNFLASGGDDGVVRLWDIKTSRTLQAISDKHARWGQITALKFISVDGGSSIEWLCIGTGRGLFIVYRRTRKSPLFHELTNKCVFSSGDSVENISYDPRFGRIAITSHYGIIRVYRLEKESGSAVELWQSQLLDTIPRAAHFADQGNTLFVYAMETGAVYCYDVETATEKSVKCMKTAIGNVDVCTVTGCLILDNMCDGFDLYPPNRTAPICTFKVDTTMRFVKAAVFGEGGQVVVTGSDHGKVYVFGTDQKQLLQVLRHSNGEDLIQAITTKSTKHAHLIVSGASNGKRSITVWKKVRKQVPAQPAARKTDAHLFMNVVLGILLAIFTRDIWLPLMKKNYASFSPFADRTQYRDSEDPRHSSLAEILVNLDNDILQQLLGVGKIPEERDAAELDRTDDDYFGTRPHSG